MQRNIRGSGCDVASMLPTILTVIGTILSLLGTGCAVVAYRSTWQEHGDGPLLPRVANWMARMQNRIRRFIGKPRTRTIAVGGAISVEAALSARAVVTGPTIPGDAGLDRRVELLILRVENMERQAAEDRSHQARELAAVRDGIDKVSMEATQAAAAVEEKAKAMVLDSVRIQLLGLVLVGVGPCLSPLLASWGRHSRSGRLQAVRGWGAARVDEKRRATFTQVSGMIGPPSRGRDSPAVRTGSTRTG